MNLRFWTLAFWKDIGYGLGSSTYLAERLVHVTDLRKAGVILELGAGTGQVTEHILREKGKDTRCIAIELGHESFVELTEKFGDVCELHEISAAHIETILPEGSVDVILSTLPLGSISRDGVDAILRASQSCLKSGGIFIQYQYALQNLSQVKQYFVVDDISLELRNFWPAFIYRAHKK